jgi:outer membrane protein
MLRTGTKRLLIGVMALLMPAAVWAQGTGKIAILNMARAMEMTMEGKQAIADFQVKLTAKQNELQKKNNDLEEMRKQLQTQGQTLADDARVALAKKIEQGTTDLQRSQEDAQKEFGQMQQEIYSRLGVKLGPVVDQYAKENQIAMILDPSSQNTQVVYYDPALEITDDIVKRYDAAPATGTPAAKPAVPTARPAAPAAKPAAPAPAPPKTK